MNTKLIKLEVLICILLSLVLAGEWFYSQSSDEQQFQDVATVKSDETAVIELPKINKLNTPVGNYSELVDRPLFIEGRKPIVEEVVDTTKTVELGQIDDWILMGIYNKDNKPIALFSKKNEPKKYQKIGVDQVLSGWVMKEVLPDQVVLQQAGQLKTVMLRKPRINNKPPSPPKNAVAPKKPPVKAPPAPNTNPEKEQ